MAASADAQTIETLDKPLSRQEFFDKYVSQRKPVKFSFVLDEFQKVIEKWKDDSYLLSKAGNEMVSAEVRSSLNEKFGISTKQQMKFSAFLNTLHSNKGDDDDDNKNAEGEKYYLTVQDIEANEFGPTKLFASPMNERLMEDVPLKPSILNYLELYQINCWMGHSVKGSSSKLHFDFHDNLLFVVRGKKQFGSSSKLHFDFHDNLLFVIRGKKQFQLFPPTCLRSLYVNGEPRICNVFDNGLITYNEDFREDGASRISVLKWDHQHNGNEEENNEEEEDEDGDDLLGAFGDYDEHANGDEMDEQEQLLDALLDKKLQQMEQEEVDDGFEEIEDDFKELEEEMVIAEEDDAEPPKKKRKLNEQEDEKYTLTNFSAIDLSEDDDILFAKYPKYAKIAALKQTVTINEGEMLYLPCGWFHEVTSFSNPELQSHFALNYWLHPLVSDGSIEKPYVDDFWTRYNRQF
eukprot:CAMPEP_0197079584 /NCGR_PEP_ID=MMETSP1384-20130603/213697_1 /TAXON_ID=29189 /ORGANISM="Ammonia sp." /LENGTH=461 /DNA_ID=CAMNT_0042518463 /DNA_START=22 /DNA_END=1404 /DNA_ORIENTATION=+